MNIIKFQNASCTHCYKCIRNCDVKAIRMEHGQAQIIADLCTYCGHCMEICPQHAKTFDSDLVRVKEMIKRGEKVVASVESSYQGILSYGKPHQLSEALHKLGFYQARETAEGAMQVGREYFRLLEEGKMENIISTNCPSIVYLIEKYYPMLVPYMAPVISPPIAHGKLIKQLLGADVKVVFIGACVSRKVEASGDAQNAGAVDAVIDFDELEDWLAEEGIVMAECEGQPFENPDPMIFQLNAINGGIVRSMNLMTIANKYKKLSVSGMIGCRELLHSMKRGYMKDCFVELDMCRGGCVNGPCITKRRGYRFKATIEVENSSSNAMPPMPIKLPSEMLVRSYSAKVIREKVPTEEEIQNILKTIGKSGTAKEFNCGACGYSTCREKAIAIYQGKADSSMCLLRSFERARSRANLVMEMTPNIIMIINKDLRITEFNRKAEEVFKVSRGEALRMYLFDLINPADFENVLISQKNVYREKREWRDFGMYVLETIVYIPEFESILAIVEDITEDEHRKEALMDKKLETIHMAQTVIDKQMTTAQEIAGLLGETTAETKAILTKLRDFMLSDEETEV